MSSIRTACSGLLAGLAAAALAGGAAHAAQSPLRDRLFGPSDDRLFPVPMVGRFQADDGTAFVLDRTAGRQVFMKFDTSPEIWVLNPTPGPRGDTIYKNDTGEPMLRATRLGGLTLFTSKKPSGVAAAFMGEAALLRPPQVVTMGALFQSFAQASARVSHTVRHPILFEEVDQPLTAIGAFADAATVVAEAFVQVAARGERTRKLAARFSKVHLSVGPIPGAQVSADTLTVIVDPDRGVAGRPSSRRIAAALTRR